MYKLGSLRRTLLVLLLLVLSPTGARFIVYGSELEGKLIQEIQLLQAENLAEEEFFRLIEIQPGEMYDEEKIREGLQKLYLKEFFSDVVVKAYPEGQGIRLVYETAPLIRLVGYKIKGNAVFSDKELVSMVRPKKGERFSEYQLKNSLEKLTRQYHEWGYFEARVTHRIKTHPNKDGATVYLRIQEGRAPSLLSLQVEGNTVFPTDTLRKKLRSRQGQTYNPRVLEDDLTRIQQLYLKKNYRIARVEKAVVLRKREMGAEVEIRVDEGPSIDIVFEGHKRIKSKKLLPRITISPEEGYGPDVLRESKEAIIGLYKKRGYHFVEVEARTRAQDGTDRVTVVFSIDEGPRVTVSRIELGGHEKIDGEAIKSVLATREKGLWQKGLFQEAVWEEDLENVSSLYHRRGFLQAAVAGKDLQFSEDRRSVRLSLAIREGRQTSIREIALQGNSQLATETLRQALQSRVGAAYTRDRAEEDIAEILALYFTRGFLQASVTLREDFSDQKESVRLLYTIKENHRTKLGEIYIWGNQKTKAKVITRELQKEEFYNPQFLLTARQKLLKLGIFEGLDLSPFRTRTVDGALVQDLQVRVKEKPTSKVTLALGYDTEQRFRSALSFARTNIRGRNRDFTLSGQMNSLKRGVSVDYHEPWLFNRPIDSDGGLYFRQEEDRESFTLETLGVKFGLAKELLPSITGNLRYELERIRTTDVDPGAVLSSKDEGQSHLAHVNLSLARDTRDMPLDPSRGSINDLGFKLFSHVWGSEADFLRVSGSSSWFVPMFGRHVLALSGQIGWIEKFRRTKEVPIAERFFTGGAGTVRGFKLNEIGPRGGDRSVVGGSSLAVLNLEGRFQVTERLSGVLFFDLGNTWLENGDFMGSLRESAGLGFRVKTPLGPVRVDWGFKLDQKKDEDLSRLHFSFGQAF